MDQIFYDAVGSNPIIAAVKSMEDIEKCCAIEEIQVIFILFGDVCSIDRIVKQGERCRKGCDGTCRSDQRTQPERNFGRISARTYRSRWNHINKAVTDQESEKNLECIRFSDIFCWTPWHLKISDSNNIW